MTVNERFRALSGPPGHPTWDDAEPARPRDRLGSSWTRGAGATVVRRGVEGWRRAVLVAVAAAATLGALPGCDPRQTGNGVYAERTVHVPDFVGVRVEDGIGAVITVAPGLAQSVTLTGDGNVVEDNLRAAVDIEGAGTAAVAVLHVWASPSFTPVIPPRVVIRRPSLALVRGTDGVFIEVTRPAGSADVGGPLAVELRGATLSARDYPVAGAVVDLQAGSTARLHSDGPVTGTVSADSHLDNTRGAGSCLVSTAGAASVACNERPPP